MSEKSNPMLSVAKCKCGNRKCKRTKVTIIDPQIEHADNPQTLVVCAYLPGEHLASLIRDLDNKHFALFGFHILLEGGGK